MARFRSVAMAWGPFPAYPLFASLANATGSASWCYVAECGDEYGSA
jgi:hypothetical protein